MKQKDTLGGFSWVSGRTDTSSLPWPMGPAFDELVVRLGDEQPLRATFDSANYSPPNNADLRHVRYRRRERHESPDIFSGNRVSDDTNGCGHIPNVSRIPSVIRSAFGTYSASSVGLNGTGVNGAPTRPTGASR